MESSLWNGKVNGRQPNNQQIVEDYGTYFPCVEQEQGLGVLFSDLFLKMWGDVAMRTIFHIFENYV